MPGLSRIPFWASAHGKDSPSKLGSMGAATPAGRSDLRQFEVDLKLENSSGRWHQFSPTKAQGQVHIRGFLQVGSEQVSGAIAAQKIWLLFSDAGLTDAPLQDRLKRLAGHFAFVIVTPHRAIASVDRIRSHAIIYERNHNSVCLTDSAALTNSFSNPNLNEIDWDQALAVAMSGYTIGSGTLSTAVKGLRTGEAIIIDTSVRTIRWHCYDAWNVSDQPANPETELSRLHHNLIERLIKAAAGRSIAVPLSAGLDSRFIASGLRAADYKSVLLFSYGQTGNHEAETARIIASRLGYPWKLVAFSQKKQKRLYQDPVHISAIWQNSDCLTSVPFQQDWIAVAELKAAGWLPNDAIIVNGQSGDFIAGNHAPETLIDMGAVQLERAIGHVTNSIISKHYRLWSALACSSNDDRIERLLRSEAEEADAKGIGEPAGLAEFLEYQDRQAKYVVSGQKTYEAQGLDWRLPLWEDDYISFWQKLPMQHKRGQSLYRTVLERDNWAGVWRDVPVNRKTIRPRWIVPIRLAAKLAHAPLGAARWHKFERRFFSWWMDPLCTSAVVPYTTAARDTRGARHAVSWITERYLEGHRIALMQGGHLRNRQ